MTADGQNLEPKQKMLEILSMSDSNCGERIETMFGVRVTLYSLSSQMLPDLLRCSCIFSFRFRFQLLQ